MNPDELKRWATVRPGYWFRPKLYGFGATPVTWQGWALTLGGMLAVVVAVRLMPTRLAKVVVGVTIVVGLIIVSARTTDGGWRWRWGRMD